MSLIDGLRYRLRAVFGARRHARDAERELRFHLDVEAAQRRHDGAPAADAEFAAHRMLGNRTAVAEAMRRVAGLGWLDATRQDVAFALRGIRRAPGFSIVAVTTLALGIGAATAIYAVVNTVLIRPLPIVDADRVLDLELVRPDSSHEPTIFFVSVPQLLRWRTELRSFAAIGAVSPMREAPLGKRSFAERPLWMDAKHVVRTSAVTPNYFSVLGTAPALGHGFSARDAGASDDRTAILSYAYWQGAYGADPHALGRTIEFDGDTYTIIGVMPKGFSFPEDTQVWTSAAPDIESFKTNEYTFEFDVVGRLRNGISPARALSELRTRFASDTVGVRSLTDLRVAAPRVRDALVEEVATHLV